MLLAALIGGAAAAAPQGQAMVVAVSINGVEVGPGAFLVLRLDDGRLAVSVRDLRSWRLKLAGAATLQVDGQDYVVLSDLPGVQASVDPSTQTLALSGVPASAFDASTVTGAAAQPMPLTPSGNGGFLNYDLNWQRSAGRESGAGLFELGLFSALGVGTTSGLWRHDEWRPGWARLDTTWTVDMPAAMQSLRLGDSISRSGSWGQSVRFGGIQWASNFATQPSFVPFPMPSLHGEAALPSTVDVLLNNTRVLRTEVEPGAFDLPSVPVVTGQGELQLVVRDVLGRQQVVIQSFYSGSQLRKPGLSDFSVELGALREGWGTAQSRYGAAMLVATQRLGLSERTTGEGRIEVLQRHRTLGLSLSWIPEPWGRFLPGVFSAGGAYSQGRSGQGGMLFASVDRQARDFSVNLWAQYAERGFEKVGDLPGAGVRQLLRAGLGVPLGGGGLGLSYVQRQGWDGSEGRVLLASWGRHVGSTSHAGVYALRDLSRGGPATVGLVFTSALGEQTSLSAALLREPGATSRSVQLQRNPVSASGLGYRLLAADEHSLAGAVLRSPYGTLSAEAARAGGQTSVRAGATGGIAVAGGAGFLSLRIDDSFAVVKVGEQAGVRVYRDNQEVATTDARGLALVTGLHAYQENQIGIASDDLPMEVEMLSLQLKLAPSLHSGVVADFPVRTGRSVELRIVGDDGLAFAPGSLLRIEGTDRDVVVGRDGRTFASGLGTALRLVGQQRGQRCVVELTLEPGDDSQPDLGTQICKGTAP